MSGIVGGIGVIVLRLWDLQILNSSKYKQLSTENRIRISLIPAPRGTIADINGEILVTNIPAYDVIVEVDDLTKFNPILEKLAYLLKVDKKVLENNLSNSKNLPHFPKLVKSNISYENMSIINSFPNLFIGARVEHNLIRNYPYVDKTSHLLGFINWATKEENNLFPIKKIASSQILGKSGTERAFNDLLIGQDGGLLNEVDSIGKPIKLIEENTPTPGLDLKLTIDIRLQTFIYELMEYNGTVIVMDVDNSNLIAMVSKPGFDPNSYIEGIDEQQWNLMLKDPDGPLNDRCIRGLYSPGSTFKPLVSYAALDTEHITDKTEFNCPGYFRQGRQVYNCWKSSGHGNIDLVGALEQSCNVYFYNLGRILGIDTIAKYASMFGFGEKTNIILPHEINGILPTPKWKLSTLKEKWVLGETINISIGQGHITSTPIQLLTYFNMLINGGNLISPRLIADIIDPKKNSVLNKNEDYSKLKINKSILLNHQHLNIITQGLDLCVNSNNGSGVAARSSNIKILGKTGTTQIISSKNKQKIIEQKGELDDRLKNHGLFVGYTESINDKKISIVVILENSTSSSFAASFAKKTLEYYDKLTKNDYI